MNVARGFDGSASDRLLEKAFTRGRALRRRARLIQRTVVAGFVAVIATGALAGTTLADRAPSIAPTATQPPLPPDTQYEQVIPVQITASSATSGHPAAAADDNDLDTYWATGRQTPSGVGVGQSLQLGFSPTVRVAAVALFSGAHFPAGSFVRAARPRAVELYFSSGPPILWQLSDNESLQTLKFAPRPSSSLRVVILSVYAGTAKSGADHVCAISEVFAYTAAS